jgi:hypothetical protein
MRHYADIGICLTCLMLRKKFAFCEAAPSCQACNSKGAHHPSCQELNNLTHITIYWRCSSTALEEDALRIHFFLLKLHRRRGGIFDVPGILPPEVVYCLTSVGSDTHLQALEYQQDASQLGSNDEDDPVIFEWDINSAISSLLIGPTTFKAYERNGFVSQTYNSETVLRGVSQHELSNYEEEPKVELSSTVTDFAELDDMVRDLLDAQDSDEEDAANDNTNQFGLWSLPPRVTTHDTQLDQSEVNRLLETL